MSSAPDLSKIVEIIMQNPELISTISSLISKGSENADVTESSENDITVTQPSVTEVEASIEPTVQPSVRNAKHYQRKDLLGALKPYLSENRRAAIDSMISISDILSLMRKEGQ